MKITPTRHEGHIYAKVDDVSRMNDIRITDLSRDLVIFFNNLTTLNKITVNIKEM